MNLTLNGKVALVTGASHGIGRAIAGRLSREGAGGVVNYERNVDDAGKLVSEIKSSGGKRSRRG